MTGWRKILAAAVVAALAVAACGGDDADSAATSTEAPVQGDTTIPDRADREPPSLPERVPTETDPTVTGEVPDEFLTPVIEDAATLAGVDPADVTVVTAQEVVWPDGSLGCAEPGVVYTQAQIQGYWVVVEVNGVGFDYRLNDGGAFRLCTNPFGGPGGTQPTS